VALCVHPPDLWYPQGKLQDYNFFAGAVLLAVTIGFTVQGTRAALEWSRTQQSIPEEVQEAVREEWQTLVELSNYVDIGRLLSSLNEYDVRLFLSSIAMLHTEVVRLPLRDAEREAQGKKSVLGSQGRQLLHSRTKELGSKTSFEKGRRTQGGSGASPKKGTVVPLAAGVDTPAEPSVHVVPAAEGAVRGPSDAAPTAQNEVPPSSAAGPAKLGSFLPKASPSAAGPKKLGSFLPKPSPSGAPGRRGSVLSTVFQVKERHDNRLATLGRQMFGMELHRVNLDSEDQKVGERAMLEAARARARAITEQRKIEEALPAPSPNEGEAGPSGCVPDARGEVGAPVAVGAAASASLQDSQGLARSIEGV